MKILLLSDIPPCDNFTAGLVLSAMVRFVPRDEICCFIVANPLLTMQLSVEFANVPTEVHPKPNENWTWLPRGRFTRWISPGITFFGETLTEFTAVRSLIRKAVAFGHKNKVDRVWSVLQGQTMIRMSKAVAGQLDVPLYTHVWDPFSWWAKANCLDHFTTSRVQLMFDDAVSSSRCVATASEPMAELYHRRFGVAAVPVISSHPKEMGRVPDFTTGDKTPVTIGMAGQFYAAAEWMQLVRAMQASDWTVAGRPVRIVVVGPQSPPGAIDENVSFLGWKSQHDAALILSQCEVLYCPYPFDSHMEEVSRNSFPSKLVLYLAAGRPILFHGPSYSSPAAYLKSRECGVIASHSLATAVYNELERVVSNTVLQRTLCANAQAAFIKDFTLESMNRSFNTFIKADISKPINQAKLYNHRNNHTNNNIYYGRLTDTQRNHVRFRVARAVSALHNTGIQYSRSILRMCALRIPRLRELYIEIHQLYYEKRELQNQLKEIKYQQQLQRCQSHDKTIHNNPKH